jgi:phenylpropionate dioxygenase-like ring-hydroxylating dioxygenase large terminal subunit
VDIVAERKPAERKVTTLATLNANQQAAIRRIPAEADAIVEPLEATRPNAIFTGRERFDAEQARIFRRFPVPVTLSALLPEPGMVTAHDGYGVPLMIVSRTRDGTIKAFLNACQHKGSKLLEDCAVHKQWPRHLSLSRLDLRHRRQADRRVPQRGLPEDLDKSQRGLVELKRASGAGCLCPAQWFQADWSQLSSRSPRIRLRSALASAHVYGRKTFELKANWKVVLEPFLEGYHVQRLHAASIGDLSRTRPISSTCSAPTSVRCPVASATCPRCSTRIPRKMSTSW